MRGGGVEGGEKGGAREDGGGEGRGAEQRGGSGGDDSARGGKGGGPRAAAGWRAGLRALDSPPLPAGCRVRSIGPSAGPPRRSSRKWGGTRK